MAEPVPASVTRVSFSCPRCGAHAHQTWYAVHARDLGKDKLPNVISESEVDERLNLIREHVDDEGKRKEFESIIRRNVNGDVFFIKSDEYARFIVVNLSISECYSCNQISVWRHGSLLFPAEQQGPEPNPDLPEHIRADFYEARTILDLSPRGAAALLRLCIQKLCDHLEAPGDNLNHQIGALVAQGLPNLVKKALDVVRVVGNNAVHPGQIDLRDDRETAETLFVLVNKISESMITHESTVERMYGELPENIRRQIERRDGSKD